MSSLETVPAPTDRSSAELRWSYTRGRERQHCRLALDTRQRSYELLVWTDNELPVSLERFPFACDAIERQSDYEAGLVAEGFTLESFVRRRDN